MVHHECANARISPLGVYEQEWDVGFIELDIWYHEPKPNDNLTIEDHHAEVWIL